VDVFFDNLQVVHTRGQILEEAHYYLYGMKIANISSRAAGTLQNRYLYQGDFSEFDEETGYNEFYLRHYDPQIGRWTTADPYEEFASLYLAMGNNPVLNIDATGACVWCESLENALTLTEVVVIMPRPSAVLSTRILGGLKAVFGLLEAGVGIAAGLATSWTGVGAVGGALVAAHGGGRSGFGL